MTRHKNYFSKSEDNKAVSSLCGNVSLQSISPDTKMLGAKILSFRIAPLSRRGFAIATTKTSSPFLAFIGKVFTYEALCSWNWLSTFGGTQVGWTSNQIKQGSQLNPAWISFVLTGKSGWFLWKIIQAFTIVTSISLQKNLFPPL